MADQEELEKIERILPIAEDEAIKTKRRRSTIAKLLFDDDEAFLNQTGEFNPEMKVNQSEFMKDAPLLQNFMRNEFNKRQA